MAKSNFVHLHVHSENSLLDGLESPSNLIEKAKELLDWKPEISIDEGIESVINWYLDNEKIASKINLYF